jgi:hypothetical protein
MEVLEALKACTVHNPGMSQPKAVVTLALALALALATEIGAGVRWTINQLMLDHNLPAAIQHQTTPNLTSPLHST